MLRLPSYCRMSSFFSILSSLQLLLPLFLSATSGFTINVNKPGCKAIEDSGSVDVRNSNSHSFFVYQRTPPLPMDSDAGRREESYDVVCANPPLLCATSELHATFKNGTAVVKSSTKGLKQEAMCPFDNRNVTFFGCSSPERIRGIINNGSNITEELSLNITCRENNGTSSYEVIGAVTPPDLFADLYEACEGALLSPELLDGLTNGSNVLGVLMRIALRGALRQNSHNYRAATAQDCCEGRHGGRPWCGFRNVGPTESAVVCVCRPAGVWDLTTCSNGTAVSFFIGGIVAVATAFFCICCYKKESYFLMINFVTRKYRSSKAIEAFLKDYDSQAVKQYRYSEVRTMTKSFCIELGKGGFGTVFKGQLCDGRHIAVKVLRESRVNDEDFINEVASIGRTNHANILNLLGFCYEGSKRALLYEYMPNGSLDKFLFAESRLLEWEKLFVIALGVARGLEYLHKWCQTRIVHFDIKPHNILLDEDFRPRISDFGMAKPCKSNGSNISMADARGTIGYIAPEVCSRGFGMVSSKSDVYSYGMVIFDMVGARRVSDWGVQNCSENYFPNYVYDHLEQCGNLRYVCGVTTECDEIARKMILVGLWCIQMNPINRPSMGKVVEMLEGSVADLQMPPKPFTCSPSVSHLSSIDTTCSSG